MKELDNEFKLDELDLGMIRRIYLIKCKELGVSLGGPELWFFVILHFLKHKGYDITKK